MMKKTILCLVAFIVGCATCVLCFGQSDAEKSALDELNRVHGTGFTWCDKAYQIALSEAAYWNANGGLWHRKNYYAYGCKFYQRSQAVVWKGSQQHRNGIARDWKNGKVEGAVAIVGNVAYFAPVPSVLSAVATCNEHLTCQVSAKITNNKHYKKGSVQHIKRKPVVPKIRNALRNTFR